MSFIPLLVIQLFPTDFLSYSKMKQTCTSKILGFCTLFGRHDAFNVKIAPGFPKGIITQNLKMYLKTLNSAWKAFMDGFLSVCLDTCSNTRRT